MAERISWLSCWSRPPSFSASDTMVISSSSVMPWSSEGWKIMFSSRFHWENRKFRGRRTSRNTRRMGAENMAKPSACSLARLLGEISPKISTTSVSTTVEMVGP